MENDEKEQGGGKIVCLSAASREGLIFISREGRRSGLDGIGVEFGVEGAGCLALVDV